MSKKPTVKSILPTVHGDFEIWAYEGSNAEMPHLALVAKGTDLSTVVPVRVHSECMTGDVFGSKRCDCGQQLNAAMDFLAKNGGILIYLRQEGRGIGLRNKLEAYNLQDSGLDTIDANHALGFETDLRAYDDAFEILESMEVHSIRLITNNPDKVRSLQSRGIDVVDVIALPSLVFDENRAYLQTKVTRMGHQVPNID